MEGENFSRLIVAYSRLQMPPDKMMLYKLRDKVCGDMHAIVATDSVLFL